MRLRVAGCKPLVIPERLILKESGRFDSTTSYASKLVTRLSKKNYIENQLPFKLGSLNAFRVVIEAEGYSSYFEPLAGVGLSVRLFEPEGEVYLNDLDAGCCTVLRENFPSAVVTNADAVRMDFPRADVIFVDFNDFTLKRYLAGGSFYKGLLDKAFEAARKFVILNDCSVFYFRYGLRSYGVYGKLLGSPIKGVEDYLRRLQSFYAERYPQWCLVRVQYFRDSSFQLFSKKPLKFCLSSSSRLPVKISEGLFS